MSKLSKNAKIAIGASVATVIGGLAYFMLSSGSTSGKAVYTDEQLLAVAKELKKELFPAWHLAFDMARKLKMMLAAQTGSNPQNLPPQYQQLIFQKAVAENPLFAKMVEKIENEVISKHNMNRDDYEASFNARVEANTELKKIEDYMVATMNRAGNGNIALPRVAIPEALTPLRVFELLVHSERSKIQKVAGVFAEYVRNGSMPNEQDPAFNMKMEQAMGDNIEVPGLDEIEGLNDSEHHPLALFMMTQNLYTQQNKDGFRIALQQFMQSVQLNTQALAMGQLNPSNIDEFMKKLESMGDAEIQKFKEKLNPTPVEEETTETPAEETTETPAEETTETPAEETTETTETPVEETTETPAEEETIETPVEEETAETPVEETTETPVEETTETPVEETAEAPVEEETTETPAEEETTETPVEEGDAHIEEETA